MIAQLSVIVVIVALAVGSTALVYDVKLAAERRRRQRAEQDLDEARATLEQRSAECWALNERVTALRGDRDVVGRGRFLGVLSERRASRAGLALAAIYTAATRPSEWVNGEIPTPTEPFDGEPTDVVVAVHELASRYVVSTLGQPGRTDNLITLRSREDGGQQP